MTTAAAQQLPQLTAFNRVLELPVVELAVNKSASTYARLKDSHQLLHWALSNAESRLSEASRQAVPYARKLESPLSYVDQKLCQGLDIVEQKMPIVKEKPEMLYEVALNKVRPFSHVADYLLEHASNIKNVSWNKLNEILNTHYGTLAVLSLNNTATIIDTLIDKYFPPTNEEKYSEVIPLEEDKLMHTLQTIGRLPVKAAVRVYSRVTEQLPKLSGSGLASYMNDLLEFLRVANYLGSISAEQDLHQLPKASTPCKSVAFANDCKS